MPHTIRPIAAVAAAAALTLAGCAGSARKPSAPARKTTTAQPPPAGPHYAVVPASESDGVAVTKLPKRWRGKAGIEGGSAGLPDRLVAGKASRVTLHYFAGSRSRSPVGITLAASRGALRCGAPFLATYGHAYAVTCTFTPRTGHSTVSLEELDPATGKPSGTVGTFPVRAS